MFRDLIIWNNKQENQIIAFAFIRIPPKVAKTRVLKNPQSNFGVAIFQKIAIFSNNPTENIRFYQYKIAVKH